MAISIGKCGRDAPPVILPTSAWKTASWAWHLRVALATGDVAVNANAPIVSGNYEIPEKTAVSAQARIEF